jgi:hypothetical protein
VKTRIIEATNGFNWGRFLVGQFDEEWNCRSLVAEEGNRLVLQSAGFWSADPRWVWVLDLVTREGAYFNVGGDASADLMKHQIWVCPMYEPFLKWLYKQHFKDIDELQSVVDLTGAPSALAGYRRPGPEGSARSTAGTPDADLEDQDPRHSQAETA